MEVEMREETSSSGHRNRFSTILLASNTSVYPTGDGPIIIVRVEEILLVVLILVIWIAAIALFFNRWGKIRMLEPYQPKFNQQAHRPSCPLAPLSPPLIPSQANLQQRMSFSKYNVNALTDPLSILPSPIIRRPRQNSMFLGSTITHFNPPRKVKSAIDIHHLIINETSTSPMRTFGHRKGSVIPILNRDRYLSIPVDRLPTQLRSKPRIRRSSCIYEDEYKNYDHHNHHHHYHHQNFISLDQHNQLLEIYERKGSTNSENPLITVHQPIIHLESTSTSSSPSSLSKKNTMLPNTYICPKMSRSFDQPLIEKPKPKRMANSLDVSSFTFDKFSTIEENKGSMPIVSIHLDDVSSITSPLLQDDKTTNL